MELTCPISLDIFEDPVSTPCCGNAFSRAHLQEYLLSNSDCPLCRTNIKRQFPEFNVSVVPTNRTIASLVDVHQASVNDESRRLVPLVPPADGATAPAKKGPSWKCNISPVISKNGARLPVDHLQLEVDWPSYEGEVCMFIPVIDQSGSMSGKPFSQVKEALMHMLHQTMAHRSVFTCIIPYNSSATSIRVPRDGSADTERWGAVQERVMNMRSTGGTSFLNAFQEIKNVVFGDTRGGRVRAQAFAPGTAEYEQQRRLGRQGLLVQGAPAFVTSISIVFMTDGQDNSRMKKGQSLVDELKFILQDWKKEVVVHTVGFSRNHDFDFLDKLRKVGSKEGMFRYADPSDGDDALCSKLGELTDSVIAMGGAFPVQVTLPTGWKQFTRSISQTSSQGAEDDRLGSSSDESSNVVTQTMMMEQGRGSSGVFILRDQNKETDQMVSLVIPDAQGGSVTQYHVPVVASESESASTVEWEAYLCEEVVREALELGQMYKESRESAGKTKLGSDFYLHAALLLQRAKCLEAQLKSNRDSGMQTRLDMCAGQISNMLQGKDANAARLNDASAVIKTVQSVTPLPPPPPQKHPSALSHTVVSVRNSANCVTRSKFGKGVLCGRKGTSDLHELVLSSGVSAIQARLVASSADMLLLDESGNSAVGYAAMIGKQKALEVMLKEQSCHDMLTHTNKEGYCPFEVAALRGYWKSAALIQSAGGADHLKDCHQLLTKILTKGYVETAALIAGCGIGGINVDMLKGRVPIVMLEKAMLKTVESELEKATTAGASSSPKAAGPINANWGNGYLKRACQNGMFELVSKCVKQGVVPQSESELKELLRFCVQHEDQGYKIADCLVQCFQDSSRDKALELGDIIYECATEGYAQLLEVLLSKSPHEVNYICPTQGDSPLISACRARKMECIMLLLRSNADTSHLSNSDTSAIIASIQRNHCAGVATLLTAGAPLIYINRRKISFNIIEVCCESSRPEILDIILKHCDKIMSLEKKQSLMGEMNSVGFSPLFLAVKYNDPACIKVLISHGANVSQTMTKTAQPKAKCVEGVSNSSSSSNGSNALHYSVSLRHFESALALLESGLNVNSCDATGKSALHIAVTSAGSLSMVRMLRSFGIDLFIKDNNGKTASAYIKTLNISEESEKLAMELLDPALAPLMEAARCVNVDMKKRLCSVVEKKAGIPGYLNGGLCLDIHSGDGWTPLLEAICVGNLNFAQSLVRAGADVLRCDERGLNALFWAKALHGEGVVNSLTNQRPGPLPSTTDLASSLSSMSMVDSFSGFKLVMCKNGELAVSSEAFDWMESNFPLTAAQAFACDALKLALTAQGFEVHNTGDEEWVVLSDQMKMEGERLEKLETNCREILQTVNTEEALDSISKNAYELLLNSVSREDNDKQLLNAYFYDMFGVKGNSELNWQSAFSDNFNFSRRMWTNGDIPNFTTSQCQVEHPLNLLDAPTCTSVLGFLQDVADSRTKWPEGPEAMAVLLSNTRMIAIGAVAGALLSSHTIKHLTFGDTFVLVLFSSVSSIYSNINKSLLAQDRRQVSSWMNLMASFARAYDKLPVVVSSDLSRVYSVVHPDLLDLISFNPSRPCIYWNGFLCTTSDWSKLFDGEQSSGHSVKVIISIRSKTGKSVSSFSSSPTNCEVLFLPQTCFQIVSIYSFDELSAEQEPSSSSVDNKCENIGDALKAVKLHRHCVIELEEL